MDALDNFPELIGGHNRAMEAKNILHRCGQPGQQHGRRLPSLSCVRTRSTCSLLVSALLTETVQQIHSLRASGVMSSQAASAALSEIRAFRKSGGILWTTPLEIAFLGICFPNAFERHRNGRPGLGKSEITGGKEWTKLRFNPFYAWTIGNTIVKCNVEMCPRCAPPF